MHMLETSDEAANPGGLSKSAFHDCQAGKAQRHQRQRSGDCSNRYPSLTDLLRTRAIFSESSMKAMVGRPINTIE